MKKKFLLAFTVLLIGTFSYTYAQNEKFSFGIGINAGALHVPAIASTVTAGVDFKAEYLVIDNLGVNASAGYLYSIPGSGFGLIPILVGANYYVGEKFFTGLKTGVTIYPGQGIFTLSPSVGIKLGKATDLSLNYNYYSGGSGFPLFLRFGINF